MLMLKVIDSAKGLSNIATVGNSNSVLSPLSLLTARKYTLALISGYQDFLKLKEAKNDFTLIQMTNLLELLNENTGVTGTKTVMVQELISAIQVEAFTELYAYYYINDMGIDTPFSENITRLIDYMLLHLAMTGHRVKEDLA